MFTMRIKYKYLRITIIPNLLHWLICLHWSGASEAMKTIQLQETVATSGAGEENGKGAGLVKLWGPVGGPLQSWSKLWSRSLLRLQSGLLRKGCQFKWVSLRIHCEAYSANVGQSANCNQLLPLECTAVSGVEKYCYAAVIETDPKVGIK